LSAPPDARPYQGRPLAPNEIRGAGTLSRAEIIQQNQDASIRSQEAEAERKRQAEIAKAQAKADQAARAAARRRKNKSKRQEQTPTQSVDVFATYRELKAKGKAQGIDTYQADIKQNLATGQVKASAKGVESKEARQKREDKEAQRLIDDTIADLKAKGTNLNQAKFTVGKSATGGLKITGKIKADTKPTVSANQATTIVGLDEQSFIAQQEAQGLHFTGKKTPRAEGGFDYEFYNVKEFAKNRRQENANRAYIKDLKRQGYVQTGTRALPGGGEELEFGLPQEPVKEFKPGIGEQLYRGTVTYGAEFVGGVAKFFSFAPGVSEKTKRQGEENVRQFTEKFGADKEHPVYGGFSGLSAGLGASLGDTNAQAQLADANKAFKERPVEFIAASAVDVGAGLIGLRGGKGGSVIKPAAATKGTLKQEIVAYNKNYPAQGPAKLKKSEAFTIPAKSFEIPKKEVTIKPASFKIKGKSYDLPQQSFDIPEAKGGQTYEAFKPAKMLKFRPLGESSETIGTRVEAKPTTTKSYELPKLDKDLSNLGNKGKTVLKLEPKTTTKEPKTIAGSNPGLAAKLKKELDAVALKGNLKGRLEPLILPRKAKVPKTGKAPEIRASSFAYEKIKYEAPKERRSRAIYSVPKTPLGFGGLTGAERVRRKREKTETELQFLTRPGESLGIGRRFGTLESQNLTERLSARVNKKQGSLIKIENLLLLGKKTKGGTVLKTDFGLGSILKDISEPRQAQGLRIKQGLKTQTKQRAGLVFGLPKLQRSGLTRLPGGIKIPTPGRKTVEKTPREFLPKLKFAGAYRQSGRSKNKSKRRVTLREFQVKDVLSAVLGEQSGIAKGFEKSFGKFY